ncbi:MAG: type II toxin-antitoxin system HicB family antitoxin [Clostridium sp.]|nr:type II toxin-antitoxin system HicB family antitoxin [Clostridium sp.]
MSKYSVFMYYDAQDEIYVASIPELQGCMAHGETREKALKELEAAEALWLESARDMNIEIPEPSFSATPI